MDKPVISVIIPCYNYAHFLNETVASVIGQTFHEWECIIIDDGSTDDTASVARKLVEKDHRIKYFYQKNRGLSASRNEGLKLASGDYIQFLDADDLLINEKFTQQLQYLKANPEVDIVYGDHKYLDQSTGEISAAKNIKVQLTSEPYNQFVNDWEKGFSIPIHSLLFKEKCFQMAGVFDESLPTHEDLEIQLRFSLQGFKYRYLPGTVAVYRIHNSSMISDKTKMKKGYLMALLKAFNNTNASAYQRVLAAHRYFQEFLNSVIDFVSGRKIDLNSVVSNQYAYSTLLNIGAVLLLPVYLLYKVFFRIQYELRNR